MIKHRLNELEAANAVLVARVEALEALMAAWLPEAPEPHGFTASGICSCGKQMAPGRDLCRVCQRKEDEARDYCGRIGS